MQVTGLGPRDQPDIALITITAPVPAIPIAAGVLYPSLGVELRPEWAALLMSVSSMIVATNAVLLKRVEPDLTEG